MSAQPIEEAVIESLKSMGKDDERLRASIIVNSPIWDALYPQERRHALRLMLKDACYDVETGKLQLNLNESLNESGIKLLYGMQEGLPGDE